VAVVDLAAVREAEEATAATLRDDSHATHAVCVSGRVNTGSAVLWQTAS
jgi:hypothetical protein